VMPQPSLEVPRFYIYFACATTVFLRGSAGGWASAHPPPRPTLLRRDSCRARRRESVEQHQWVWPSISPGAGSPRQDGPTLPHSGGRYRWCPHW
jgi:hypothetical protein